LILTLGHSTHSWNYFKTLVEASDVGLIIDVRSNPRSRFPHFSMSNLRVRLNGMGVSYLFLGMELGGRPIDPSASYDAMARTPAFQAGIEQVLSVAARCRPALLCSEHDPISCHRCLLVGRQLVERGTDLRHIMRDGSIVPHEHIEDRLLALSDTKAADLFASRADRLAAAYRLQEARIRGGPNRPTANGRGSTGG
jgi:uncharacterized protein (DUF488 family)